MFVRLEHVLEVSDFLVKLVFEYRVVQGGGACKAIGELCVPLKKHPGYAPDKYLRFQTSKNRGRTKCHFVKQSALISLLEFLEPINSQGKPAVGES